MARRMFVPTGFHWQTRLCAVAVLLILCAYVITYAACGSLDLVAANGNATADALTDSHAEGFDFDDYIMSITPRAVPIHPVVFSLPVLSVAGCAWCFTPPVHPPTVSH
jgi:hypothetical protein